MCWFSSNNSETVKAVTFFKPFFSIHANFIRKVCAKFGIPYLRQCPDIGQISDGDFFDFRISCQSLIEWNCYNSRTSDDIDKELEPVTKLDKKNKTRSKKICNDVISKNCDAIAIFPIYNQSGAIRKPDSGCIVCKTYVFINSNYLSYKIWKQK